MTGSSQRAALDAVHSARPLVARLSMARDKEDLAADIIDAWNAVETGLRSLIGGSALGGQLLIRELRQRHFLSLEQANALAEFHAARERANRTEYAPTEGDINAARDAFLKLETGLMAEPEARATAAPAAALPAPAPAPAPAPVSAATPVREPSSRPAWVGPLIGAAVLIAVVVGAWLMLAGRGGNAAYDEGIVAYREGRREAAEGAFRKAATDDPKDPMPHVYLARIERERGNLTNANAEAVKAVQLGGSTNGIALRELASVLFAAQNFDAARTFYIRAIQADSSDRLAQGFLGCSLVRLGRIDEGMRWMQRAGTGAWSSCMPLSNMMPNVQVPMTQTPRP